MIGCITQEGFYVDALCTGPFLQLATSDLGTEGWLLTLKFCQSNNKMSGKWKTLQTL